MVVGQEEEMRSTGDAVALAARWNGNHPPSWAHRGT